MSKDSGNGGRSVNLLSLLALFALIGSLTAALYIQLTTIDPACRSIEQDAGEIEAGEEFVPDEAIARFDENPADPDVDIQQGVDCDKERSDQLWRMLLISACFAGVIWIGAIGQTSATSSGVAIAFALIASVALLLPSVRAPFNVIVERAPASADQERAAIERELAQSRRVSVIDSPFREESRRRRKSPLDFDAEIENSVPLNDLVESDGKILSQVGEQVAIRVSVGLDKEPQLYEITLERRDDLSDAQAGDPRITVYEITSTGRTTGKSSKRSVYKGFDDDSGGNKNAKLHVGLLPGSTYLFIAETYARSDESPVKADYALKVQARDISALASMEGEQLLPIVRPKVDNRYFAKKFEGRDRSSLAIDLSGIGGASPNENCIDIYATGAVATQDADPDVEVYNYLFEEIVSNDDLSDSNEASRITRKIGPAPDFQKTILIRSRDRADADGGFWLAVMLTKTVNGECLSSNSAPPWFDPNGTPDERGFVNRKQ